MNDSKRIFQVDLSRSRAPREFRDEQNLWKDDLQRLYRLIQQQARTVRDLKERKERSDEDEAPHLSIAIFGPSGSGKSSLMRTLHGDIQRRHGGVRDDALHESVYALPVMDPTTWAPKDQFLYAFLASALEEERQMQERKQHGYPQGLSPVQLAFQEVNEYLRVVDEPEAREEYDPLGLSLQKLERHTSGLRLRRALGNFVEALASELQGPSALVLLLVDDLDMAPNHLVRSLEAYQSFLTHPRIVPVFTFTERMPEELLEAHFHDRLGARRSERLRPEGTTSRLDISEQMAVQFLTRCFPVRNRIRLGPAPARVQRALFSVQPEASESSREAKESYEVLELLTISSFLLFGHPDREDAHQVKAALRPSTLRRQFQVVDAMADCYLSVFSEPQFWKMDAFGKDRDWKTLLAQHNKEAKKLFDLGISWSGENFTPETWPAKDKKDYLRFRYFEISHYDKTGRILEELLEKDENKRKKQREDEQYRAFDSPELSLTYRYALLLHRLREKSTRDNDAWAPIFSVAAWSLLNVHRDTLRELGLFLEDLYSWSPKELRSVVLDRIIERDQSTRRTVVDRWFNRTDYRRSQVLSLLAANIFRPWMVGEEPFGDEEAPLKEAIRNDATSHPHRRKEDCKSTDLSLRDARERLAFPSVKGMLWFLNVTLGFYVPQIMARNWSDAISPDEPVKVRMSGNGWDIQHAPINAIRVADAKQEIFSFGMIFLDPRGYRHALEVPSFGSEDGRAAVWDSQENNRSQDRRWREHLLLRIWTCAGYSRGRFWSAYSLWRGLGFIGQAIEFAIRESEHYKNLTEGEGLKPEKNLEFYEAHSSNRHMDDQKYQSWRVLYEDFRRLIRAHCLAGLVPGSLLDRNTDQTKLLQGFPRWDAENKELGDAISSLAADLVLWLANRWTDVIHPMPAGDVYIGWRDCFIRRIHGEYILGGLWPRLNSAYIEAQGAPNINSGTEEIKRRRLARQRAFETLGEAQEWAGWADKINGDEKENENEFLEKERLRWTAEIAAGAWSDIILDYWRGCPPILLLFMTCPVFIKSREKFSKPLSGEARKWRDRLALPEEAWDEFKLSIDPYRLREKEELSGVKLRKQEEIEASISPTSLCIERVEPIDFSVPDRAHHRLSFEWSELRNIKKENGQEREKHVVESPPKDSTEDKKKKP